MKIRMMGAELLHADGQTDRHNEASSRLFRNFANAPEKKFAIRVKLSKVICYSF
jgi:hypothetical protein